MQVVCHSIQMETKNILKQLILVSYSFFQIVNTKNLSHTKPISSSFTQTYIMKQVLNTQYEKSNYELKFERAPNCHITFAFQQLLTLEESLVVTIYSSQ